MPKLINFSVTFKGNRIDNKSESFFIKSHYQQPDIGRFMYELHKEFEVIEFIQLTADKKPIDVKILKDIIPISTDFIADKK